MMIKLFMGIEINFEYFEYNQFKNFISLCSWLVRSPSYKYNGKFHYEIILLLKKSFVEIDKIQSFQNNYSALSEDSESANDGTFLWILNTLNLVVKIFYIAVVFWLLFDTFSRWGLGYFVEFNGNVISNNDYILNIR